jgi:hypothetical protein
MPTALIAAEILFYVQCAKYYILHSILYIFTLQILQQQGQIICIDKSNTCRTLFTGFILFIINDNFSFEDEITQSFLLSGGAFTYSLVHLGFATKEIPLTTKISLFSSNTSLNGRFSWHPLYFISLLIHLIHSMALLTGLRVPVLYRCLSTVYPKPLNFTELVCTLSFILFVILSFRKSYFTRKNYIAHGFLLIGFLIPPILAIRHASLMEGIISYIEIGLLFLGAPGINDLLLPRAKKVRFRYLISNGFPDLFAQPLQDYVIPYSEDSLSSPLPPTNQSNFQEQIFRSRQDLHASPLFLNEITGRAPTTLSFLAFLWKCFRDFRYVSVFIIISSKISLYAMQHPFFFLYHLGASFIGILNLYRLYYRTNELAFFWRILSDLRNSFLTSFLALL